ncbi:MAG: hypothetical protein ACRYHA_12045 [Janthinobacterium lividum]
MSISPLPAAAPASPVVDPLAGARDAPLPGRSADREAAWKRDRDTGVTFAAGRGAFVLSAPLRMGLLDRIIDFFRGGAKRAEIDQRVDAICAPHDAPRADVHAGRLDHFVALRDQARQKYQDRFDVGVTIDPAAESWSYAFRIDGTVLLSSTVPFEDGAAYAAFRGECARHGVGLEDDAALRGPFAVECHRHGIAPDTPDGRLLVGTAMRLDAGQDRGAASMPEAGEAGAARHPSVVWTLAPAFARINERAAARDARHPAAPRQRHADMAEKLVLLAGVLQGNASQAVKLTFDGGRGTYGVTVGHSASPVYTDTLDEHEDGQFPRLVSAAIAMEIEALKCQHDAHIRDPAAYMRGNIDTMTDNPAHKAWLEASADAPGYGSEDFTGIRDGVPGATFIAMFGAREVTFSDRGNEHAELRGVLLREALSRTTFATLGEIMRRGHMTASDPTLRYMMPVLKGAYEPALDDLSAPERAAVKREVASIPVGMTTLGALWEIDPGRRGDVPEGAFPRQTRPASTAVPDFPRDGSFA